MDRRTFLGTLAGGLLAAPLAAEAQSTRKIARIGYLTTSSSATAPGTLRLVNTSRGFVLLECYICGGSAPWPCPTTR